MQPGNAIEITNAQKYFKLRRDGANTLKDLLLIGGKTKPLVKEVLKGVSVNIKKGETVALIGTNGCGKSTLLKMMTRIIYPNSGAVETDGVITSLLELGAGFHKDFTGRENIYFNAAVFGLTEKEIDERMDRIIEFSELGSFIEEPIRTYSSGMYMRLAFSVAINVDADILLIDEILAVGDKHFQDKCYDKLQELKDAGKTIVIVTHSMDVVKELCDRAIWIYDGHFKMDGKPEDVIEAYINQIAIDHQNQKVNNSSLQHETKIMIDNPENYSHVSKNGSVMIRGWRLFFDDEVKFRIRIGNKEVQDINPETRSDVYAAYMDVCAGNMSAEEIGFNKVINVSEYLDEVKDGRMSVTAELVTGENNILSSQSLTLFVDEE